MAEYDLNRVRFASIRTSVMTTDTFDTVEWFTKSEPPRLLCIRGKQLHKAVSARDLIYAMREPDGRYTVTYLDHSTMLAPMLLAKPPAYVEEVGAYRFTRAPDNKVFMAPLRNVVFHYEEP